MKTAPAPFFIYVVCNAVYQIVAYFPMKYLQWVESMQRSCWAYGRHLPGLLLDAPFTMVAEQLGFSRGYAAFGRRGLTCFLWSSFCSQWSVVLRCEPPEQLTRADIVGYVFIVVQRCPGLP